MNLSNFFKEVVANEQHMLIPPPTVFTTPDGGVIANFNYAPDLMIQYGWREWSEEELAAWHEQYDPKPEPIDYTAFNEACSQFKLVCYQIGQAIGDSSFKGGFDEYAKFITSQFAVQNPAQAALLASMWSGANEYAKYEGAKVGLGQPDWWYKCWEEESSSSSSENA